MGAIFGRSKKNVSSFFRPLCVKIAKAFNTILLHNKVSLPNLQNVEDELNNSKYSKTVSQSLITEFKSEVFKESLKMISNEWNILRLFKYNSNADTQLDYQLLSNLFHIDDRFDIDFVVDFKTFIKNMDEYFKHFYSHEVEKCIFNDSFLEDNEKEEFHAYKLYESINLIDYIEEVEYQPFYCISYPEDVTDFLEGKVYNKQNGCYQFNMDSNTKRVSIRTNVLVFPLINTISYMILDSDLSINIHSVKYSSPEDGAKKVHELVYSCMNEYINNLNDFDKQLSNVKSIVEASNVISKDMKNALSILFADNNSFATVTNPSSNIVTSSVPEDTMVVILGNLFNNLTCEYKTDSEKYLVRFDSDGKNRKLINKPADIDEVKALKFSEDLEKSRIVTIYKDRKKLKKYYKDSINEELSKIISCDKNLNTSINTVFGEKYNKFKAKYQYYDIIPENNPDPILLCNFKKHPNGVKFTLSLAYSIIDIESDNYIKYIPFVDDIISYTILSNDDIKVEVPDNVHYKVNYNLFEKYMKRGLRRKNNDLKQSNRKFIKTVCKPFIERFIDHFSDISDIKEELNYIHKILLDKIETDEYIQNLLKAQKTNKSIVNLYENGCKTINDINNSCNDIRYESSKDLTSFLEEISYYTNWKYSMQKIV